MINNNAKKGFLFLCSGGSTGLNGTNILGNNTTYVINDYGIRAACGYTAANPNQYATLGYGSAFVAVGFGDTAESPDDYGLADGNYSNPLLSVSAYGKNASAVGDILNLYANYRNNGNSNVTVREVGIIGNPTGNSQATGSNNVCLLYRKVLDTPVVIAPGETYSFSYNVRFKS